MSAEYVVMSPLPPAELEEVERRCRKLVAAHADTGDEWGEFYLGGMIPSPEEAADMVWLPGDRGVAPRDSAETRRVLDRLATIRSAITIERPGYLDIDRMQVSILRYLIEHAGAGLVLLVDALELSESVLEDLASKQGVDDFEGRSQALPGGEAGEAAMQAQADDGAPPVVRAARALLARLREDELLEVEPSFDRDAAVESVLRGLEKAGKRRRSDFADILAESLAEAPGVVELYADDDTLVGLFRELFAGV